MVTSRRLNPDDAKKNARAGSVKLGPKKNKNMSQPVNFSGKSGSNPGSMYQNRPASGKTAGSSVSRESVRRAASPKPTGKESGKLPKNPPKNKIPSPNKQRNRGGR